LAMGQKGLSVAFDLPTHRGYDSDHPRLTGDVGKAGVAIVSVEDMKIIFDGITLDDMSVSIMLSCDGLHFLCFYIIATQYQGIIKKENIIRCHSTYRDVGHNYDKWYSINFYGFLYYSR